MHLRIITGDITTLACDAIVKKRREFVAYGGRRRWTAPSTAPAGRNLRGMQSIIAKQGRCAADKSR